jgi:hypothetical protein
LERGEDVAGRQKLWIWKVQRSSGEWLERHIDLEGKTTAHMQPRERIVIKTLGGAVGPKRESSTMFEEEKMHAMLVMVAESRTVYRRNRLTFENIMVT